MLIDRTFTVIAIVTLLLASTVQASVVFWTDPDARVIQRSGDDDTPITILDASHGLVEPRGILL